MAKDFEMGYLLDFYGEVLTPKQREMLNQYYNDDLSLSEIGENFGITRQGARDAIKHGETTLKELEAKVGFAGRYRRVQEKLEELEQLRKSLSELLDRHTFGQRRLLRAFPQMRSIDHKQALERLRQRQKERQEKKGGSV